MGHAKPRTSKYPDEFLRLTCASTLLQKPVYPNMKEVTEAMSAWKAVREVVQPEERSRSDVWMFDVASGSSPRVGALFACMSKWQCVSIDPNLGDETGGKFQAKSYPIHRLSLVPKRIQECSYDVPGLAVITAVHAHCPLPDILEAIEAERRVLVAMPCCEELTLPQEPDIRYRDEHNWSPEDEIKIWEDV